MMMTFLLLLLLRRLLNEEDARRWLGETNVLSLFNASERGKSAVIKTDSCARQECPAQGTEREEDEVEEYTHLLAN